MIVGKDNKTGLLLLGFGLVMVPAMVVEVKADQETTGHRTGAVVVTATQVEQPVEDVQASVQVVTRDEIDRFAGNNPTEVLKFTTGVEAHSSGSSSRVRIRGFDSKQVLILVDGQRRTNKYGSANINHTALEDIERIEIVRGPMSSLYGSDALGGVINIITRAPGTDPGTRVRVSGGTDQSRQRDTMNMAATHEFGHPELGHAITTEYRMRQPFRHDQQAVETDYNRLRHLFVNYRGQAELGEYAGEHRLRWTLEFMDQDDSGTRVSRPPQLTEYEGAEEERRWFVSGQYQGLLGPGEFSSRLGFSDSDAESRRDIASVESTKYRQWQLDNIYNLPVGDDHLLSVGAGWRHDDIDVSTYVSAARQDMVYILLQDQWEIRQQWQLVAGVRHDDYSNFGSTTNPRATLAWRPGPWRLRVGYGTAFRAPDATEQHISIARGTFLIKGNPDLEPEKSRTMEAAVRYGLERGHLEVVLHRSKVRNLINSVRTGIVEGGRTVVLYENVDRALLQGAEVGGHYRFNQHWSLNIGLDLLRARDDNTGDRLTGRAARTWRLGVQYEADHWVVNLRGRRVERYYNSAPGNPAPPPTFSNYHTFDLRLDRRINQGLTLFAGIDNILDQTEPDNFVITSTNQSDPDRRYYYAGLKARF